MPSLNNETRFLIELSKTTKAYRWEVRNKQIVGVARNGKRRGYKFDPITALCRFSGRGDFKNTSSGRRQAAGRLGISQLMHVEHAVVAKSNRGHSQTLRGKIRHTLGV